MNTIKEMLYSFLKKFFLLDILYLFAFKFSINNAQFIHDIFTNLPVSGQLSKKPLIWTDLSAN